MKQWYIFFLLTFCSIFSACNKNSDKPIETDGQIIGEWNLLKAVYVNTNTNISSTDNFDEGSYLRFDKNDTCYSNVNGDAYASYWKFIDNNSAVFINNSSGFDVNDSGYIIQKLIADSLKLFSKELINNATQTLYLSR